MDDTQVIRQHYDASVQSEWDRLQRFPFEFAVTKRFIDRYVMPGDRVLDIGGGPGRYALHLAEKGCQVTLLDLSDENVRFAQEKAQASGLTITAVQGDARKADQFVAGRFDCVLLMGPMYHLLSEAERALAVRAALNTPKPGGILFVSFLTLNGGSCYFMDIDPALVLEPGEAELLQCYLENRTYNGDAFTRACFIAMKEILPFMAQFPLDKLHLFGQEGITSPVHSKLCASDKRVFDRWMDIALQTCEREELLAYAAHLMYVGRLQI